MAFLKSALQAGVRTGYNFCPSLLAKFKGPSLNGACKTASSNPTPMFSRLFSSSSSRFNMSEVMLSKSDAWREITRNLYYSTAAFVSAAALGLSFYENSKVKSEDWSPIIPTEPVKNLDAARKEFLEVVGPERLLTDPSVIEKYAYEALQQYRSIMPHTAIYPLTTEEVSNIMKICHKYEIVVIPYGCGTNLEGHTISITPSLYLDFAKMNKIIRLDTDDMDATVEAGVPWIELNKHLKPSGLFFPIDPGPGASIGGMVATRCSGTNAVHYGTMKDWVLALTVVLSDGRVVKTGTKARKDAAGYDLTRLFSGSEGTLGIITEITLRLAPSSGIEGVAVCSFENVKDLCACVGSILKAGVQPSCSEYLDANSIRVINPALKEPLDERPTLMLKFHGSRQHLSEVFEITQSKVISAGGNKFKYLYEGTGAEELWDARKSLYWRTVALYGKDRIYYVTDVCVPIGKLPELISAAEKDVIERQLTCTLFGHVGDGNFHVLLSREKNDLEGAKQIKAFAETLSENAIALGGTCTGEHGVGMGKIKYLAKTYPKESIDLMKAIKALMDPKNLLNPGKVIE